MTKSRFTRIRRYETGMDHEDSSTIFHYLSNIGDCQTQGWKDISRFPRTPAADILKNMDYCDHA